MTISQTYRPVLVATHTINSAPQEPNSALRGLMQRLGLTLLACTLVIGVIGSASAGQAQDEAAVRALGDNFAKVSSCGPACLSNPRSMCDDRYRTGERQFIKVH